MVSVLLSASVERCFVSRMRDFFLLFCAFLGLTGSTLLTVPFFFFSFFLYKFQKLHNIYYTALQMNARNQILGASGVHLFFFIFFLWPWVANLMTPKAIKYFLGRQAPYLCLVLALQDPLSCLKELLEPGDSLLLHWHAIGEHISILDQ